MWANAQYCVRRCAFLAVCIGVPYWHFYFHKSRNYEKNNHNSVPKLQRNDTIWNNSKLFVIRSCASWFSHKRVAPPHMCWCTGTFVCPRQQQLFKINIPLTVLSYTTIIHFYGIHSCLLYWKFPFTSKLELQGRFFVMKVVHNVASLHSRHWS